MGRGLIRVAKVGFPRRAPVALARLAVVSALALSVPGVGRAHSPIVDADFSDWCVGAFSNTGAGGGRVEDSSASLVCGNCNLTTNLACQINSDCPGGEICINLTSKTELVWWDNRTDSAVNDLKTVATTQDNSNLYFAVDFWTDIDPAALPLVEIAIDFTSGGISTWYDPSSLLTTPGHCSTFTDRACTSDADCEFCQSTTEPPPSTRVRICGGAGCEMGDTCDTSQTCIDLGLGGPTQDVGLNSGPTTLPDYLVILDLSRWLTAAPDPGLLMENVGGVWTGVLGFSPEVSVFPGVVELAIPWSAFGCTGCPGACSCPDLGPGQDFRYTVTIARDAVDLDYAPDGAVEDVVSEAVAGTSTTTTDNCPGFGIGNTACEIADGSADAFAVAGLPRVVSVWPRNDAVDVSLGSNVTLRFSEPVNPSTVTPGTIGLFDDLTGAAVLAAVRAAPSGLKATVDPVAALSPGTIYRVEVGSGVQDPSGNPALPFAARFQTVLAASAATPLNDLVADLTVLPPFPPPPPAPPAPRGTSPTTGDNLGFSVAEAGDLNDDGLMDFVAGAPGYPVPGIPEAGAAIVCFGNPDGAQRTEPDIVFYGVNPHDRAGVAVAGMFDFDGDDKLDIMIGAEQMNRTADPPTDTGPGRVYVIYFKPGEYDLTNPPLFVSLDQVGGSISGVIFEGFAGGDRAGAALAGGGLLDTGTRQDLVIGAPGFNGGAGAAYAVFGDTVFETSTTDPFLLGNVGVDFPGRVYHGESGEGLGTAVALPGDVTGDPAGDGEDIVIGAPESAFGTVYVVNGGGLTSDSNPMMSSSIATRILGDDLDEQFGFSLAGGGDNLNDRIPDLLIGAPLYDAAELDVGRVIQISERLPNGAIDVSRVGDTSHPNPINGMEWNGVSGGDRLGWSVTALRDVTGNTLEDIGLGAPFADAGGGGAVYVVEGTANATTGLTLPASEIGQTVAGAVFVGTQDDERSGLRTAAAGDVSGDTHNDLTIGAPGFNLCTVGGNPCLTDADCTAGEGDTCADEAGTVHQVIEIVPVPPGRCDASGCTVADLETGARLVVPEFALSATVDLDVKGLVNSTFRETRCASSTTFMSQNLTLVAVAEYTPEPVPFDSSLTADVPTWPGLEYQLNTGELLRVMWCQQTFGWTDLGLIGSVVQNPYRPGQLTVTASVDELRLYAAFVEDEDMDAARDGCDCALGDATLWAPPGDVDSLLFSRDPATGDTTLQWEEPAFPGGGPGTLRYDTIRSGNVQDFLTGDVSCTAAASQACCVESNDTDMTALIAEEPPAGEVFHYIVRAENDLDADACMIDPTCQQSVSTPAALECP